MDNTQKISGSVQNIGPQAINPQSAIAASTLASATSLASIDARLAAAAPTPIACDGTLPVSFASPQPVFGDLGRTWTLDAKRDAVTVQGAVAVPGAALEAGGNLDAIALQLAALNANVLALNAAIAALAQNVSSTNGALAFVLQQLNNSGAAQGALSTPTFQ